MYHQLIPIHLDLLSSFKKIINELYDEFSNSTFKIINQNNTYYVNVEGSNGDEFNMAVKNVKSTIIRLTEINDQRRMKKKLHKERYQKKKQAIAAENIEKNIKRIFGKRISFNADFLNKTDLIYFDIYQ